MKLSRRAVLGAALGTLAAAGGCARPADPGTGGASSPKALKVGLVQTLTGDHLAVAEGARFEAGMRNGLLWSTNRSNQIGVRKFKIVRADDKGSPDVAAAAAEDLVDGGCHVLVGGFSSPVALRIAEVAARRKVLFIAATATADELTGLNPYTFRSGAGITQLLLAARTDVRPGHRLAVLAADRATAAKAAKVLGAATTIVAPATTEEFTDVAKRIKAARADQLYVDWPVTAPALWAAVPRGVETITVLGARKTWPAYGIGAGSLKLVTAYVDGATDNNGYQALRAAVPGRRTDTGHPEGFATSQLIVWGFQHGPQKVDDMIKALEGFEFGSVKGNLTVRAADHCLLQPLWGAYLTWTGASSVITAVTDRVFLAEETAPA